jgi:hypothetical protein
MKPLRLFTGALALLLLLLPLRATAENIGVSPESWDYGDVTLGESEVQSFTIESLGPDTPLRVDMIRILDDASGSFHIVSITPTITFPHYLDVGDTLEAVVSFTPGAEGLVTANLFILSNAHNDSTYYVPLQGVGIDEEPTPSELMAAVIAFFDASVADYSLYGLGNSNSPPVHLRVFEAMLDAADDLIAAGDLSGACTQLDHAVTKCDGLDAPPDFVGGPAASSLNAMLLAVMDLLGCP